CVVVRDHTVEERGAGPGVDGYPAAQAVAAVAATAAGAAPGGVAVERAVRDHECRVVRDAEQGAGAHRDGTSPGGAAVDAHVPGAPLRQVVGQCRIHDVRRPPEPVVDAAARGKAGEGGTGPGTAVAG